MIKFYITLIAVFSCLTMANVAQSHPHKHVEQQALLSVGINKTVLSIRIMPSYKEGADIFNHIDLDKDGQVSPQEQTTFAQKVINHAQLLFNDVPVPLTLTDIITPKKEQMAAGTGLIEIKASADIAISLIKNQQLNFNIEYETLAHGWFIQPFFYSELNALIHNKTITRAKKGNGITISFTPPKRKTRISKLSN